MPHSHQSPVKPEKQLKSSHFNINLDSPIFDNIDCTPETKKKMLNLKRKASSLLEQGSPNVTVPFLKWRLGLVESALDAMAAQRQALAESQSDVFFDEAGQQKTDFVASFVEDEKSLLAEKTYLLTQRKILEGDLNDSVTDKLQLEEAYINELRMSLEAASSSKKLFSSLKMAKLDRKSFSSLVNEYLGTLIRSETGDEQRWCVVLGYWLPPPSVKCAHIVPFSWNTKDMAHIFGSDEPPLSSKRNGLSLQAKIEEGFDNCWIVLVPLTSITVNPIEWKVVLLNEAIRNNIFFTDLFKCTDREKWIWGDIDGRTLSFPNDNRPARRFLYMRYALAWLHAEDNSWPGFKQKVPPGEVWASPDKPDGYLRRSILLALGKKTGDRLPKDLLSAGGFEDPSTSSIVHDEVAGLRIVQQVHNHLGGARDAKEDEESTRFEDVEVLMEKGDAQDMDE